MRGVALVEEHLATLQKALAGVLGEALDLVVTQALK
jgi:hypothetical protein